MEDWSIALKSSIGHLASRPLVSVLIPAWNAAETIGRALDSVFSSATSQIECVVVDDASTDGTADVVAALAGQDARVILIPASQNGGPSAARNLGLAAARGDWLTFLDSDDVLLPGGLDALLRGAADGQTRAVIGQRTWSDGRTSWITPAYDRADIRTPARGTSILQRPGLLYYASATGKLFHRSLAEGLSFEGRVLGDQPWTVRALLRAGDRITVIGDVVYEWRRGAAAGSSSITAAKHGSASVAAEAARVAIGALAQVDEEASAQLPDPGARRLVTSAYFERLVRSDLAGPVRRAVARRDIGSDDLFGAIEAFLSAAPPGVVEESDAVAQDILRPPLDLLPWLRPPARRAYLGLLRSVDAANPGLAIRHLRLGPLRLAVGLLLSSDGPAQAFAATLLLALRQPVVLVSWLRQARTRRRRLLLPG